MFRAFSCPSLGATITAVAASGLPLERSGSSVVSRGRSGPNRPRLTTLLPEAAIAVDKLLMMDMGMPETC
jgi:hypothetical protein